MKSRKVSSHEEWLKERLNGIGASESSAVIGLNPYMSNVELWEYKTGKKVAEDISDKPYVKYGTEAEKYLRKLFALDFPRYKVEYSEFDMYRNDKYPFIFATLDGRLTEKATGRKGILEIKTTEILKSTSRLKWKDAIPDNYYVQVLHQLLATGWDFAVLKAQLKTVIDDNVSLQTQHYFIERNDVKDDLDFLLEKEVKFWEENVLKNVKPSLILPEI